VEPTRESVSLLYSYTLELSPWRLILTSL